MGEGQSIQWFPGHMTKTKRQMEKTLKLVDAVAEIVDARIPISSRNPVIDQIIQQKPRVILLNKADMADPAQTKRWIAFYRSKGILAMPIDCKSGKGIQNFIPLVKELLKDRIASWESKGMVCRTIRVMVVGVPNVGKSSLINGLMNRKSFARTSATPGKTQTINFYNINQELYLVDLPGYGYAKVSEQEKKKWGQMIERYLHQSKQLRAVFLQEIYPHAISQRYQLESVDLSQMESYEILEAIGKKRGMLMSGGVVNTERAAIAVVDEFRSAKLGKITLEQVRESV